MKGVLALTLAALLHAPLAEGAGLTLDIRDGRVMLDAQDVTIGQILTEWARVGATLITNVERLSNARVSLRLEGVPEREALDIILRSVPGYLAAPRPVAEAGQSIYDRILILPVSTVAAAPRGPANGSAPSTLRPAGISIPGTMLLPDPDDGNEPEAAPGVTSPAPGRPPGYMPPGFVVPQGPPNQPGVPSGAVPPVDTESTSMAPNPAPASGPANPFNVSPGAATPGMPSPPPPGPGQGMTPPPTLQPGQAPPIPPQQPDR